MGERPTGQTPQSFAELSGGGAPTAAGAQVDVSFATIGETRVRLSSPADVARLSRTIELTRTALGHNLNARSSRSHCLVHLHLANASGSSADSAGVSLTKRQVNP